MSELVAKLRGPKDGGLVAAFANNPVAANLLMVIFLVGGLVSAAGLNSEVFPVVDPGIVTVTVAYPGATPAEVEEAITRRVEEAVFGIDGIDRVRSKASENLGVVTVELKDFVDAAKARNDVETAVDRLADFPPEDAEQPDIVMAELVSDVISLVVSSDQGERVLRSGVEALEEGLLRIPEVSLVSLQGARDYEIAIEISEDRLRQYNLSINDVANAVKRSSVNLASGELKTRAGDLLLRTDAKGQRGSEFSDIVLRANPDGSVLRLAEVAVIRDGFADVDLISEFNGRPSLFLQVKKSDSEDALTIAGAVKDFLLDYKPTPGIEVQVWNDQTEILESRLSLLVRNGVLGFALVFLFLVIMLDLKLALWVAMGVPISFLGALLFFGQLGVTLNMVSLFALIVVLGIVVDDAVVVGENIIAEQESGKSGVAGAIAGVRGVQAPVFVGVLTTIAAFAPLLLATGSFAAILTIVPVVVIAVLTISIIEVFYILPAHLSHTGTWSRGVLAKMQYKIAQWVAAFRDRLLVPAILRAVRYKFLTLTLAALVLVGSFSLVGTGLVRFIFFPALAADVVSASLEMPVGTPFAITQRTAERLVAAANAVNADQNGEVFESINTTIGGRLASGGGPGARSGMSVSSHSASVRIQLTPESSRSLDAVALEKLWRDKVGVITGAESLTYNAQFGSRGFDIEYELSHPNSAVLEEAAEFLKGTIANIPAATEVRDTYALGKRQFDIELTAAGEAAGLLPVDVARQLRQNFFGAEVQRIQRGRNELKVMVRYPRENRSSNQDITDARIRLPDGSLAPLSVVAQLKESRGFSEIDRIDGLRVVSVTGKVDTTLATPDEVNGQIIREQVPQLRERFPGLGVMVGGQAREQSQDLSSLGKTMLIAMMIIYTLLAAQLRSYLQPLIVLSGVPFGAGGALIGHFLLGFNLSFVSIFGMIALSGVVVNSSLVLVDRYNHMRRTTDMEPIEAVAAATQRRFRAIFLTTITTALGLLPMLLETSIQAQFLIPMAVSLATGVVFASLVVLFVVPCLIVLLESVRAAVAPKPVGVTS